MERISVDVSGAITTPIDRQPLAHSQLSPPTAHLMNFGLAPKVPSLTSQFRCCPTISKNPTGLRMYFAFENCGAERISKDLDIEKSNPPEGVSKISAPPLRSPSLCLPPPPTSGPPSRRPPCASFSPQPKAPRRWRYLGRSPPP